MNDSYKKTIRACFTGCVVQAITNNFAPLLFITFEKEYGIPLSEITVLITLNFALQLIIDFVSVYFIDKIGYRLSMIIAHSFSAAGLISLAVLPDIMGNPFFGLAAAGVLYAVGGGLLEVTVSPIVEACPNEHKSKTMSILHSFYCWGTVGVIVISTLFFNFAGIASWKALAVLWAIVPIVNGIAFIRVPIAPLISEDEEGIPVVQMMRTKIFWAFMLIMFCSGASEQSVSQWASAFAEKALGISKTVGDLAGPTLFSLFMGTSRMIYGKFGEKIQLDRMMLASSVLCIAAYLMISVSNTPIAGLAGIAVSGFSVGILWPGTFSKASKTIKGGGTAMFALLALAGDAGCTGGPTLAGKVAAMVNDNLKAGILAAIVFPIILTAALLALKRNK